MNFVANPHHTNTEITLNGQLTFADNEQFKEIISLVHGNNTESITLDLSGLSFIDSAGLGMLLLLRDECQKKNIAIAIEHVRGQVERIFMISKFDQLFVIHNSAQP